MHEVVVYDARKTKQGSVYDVQPACTLGRQSKQARKQASKASKQSKQAKQASKHARSRTGSDSMDG